MSDDRFIAVLLKIASDPHQLLAAQHLAAQKLLDYDGEIYPSDGCAITLSVLLQEAGIDVGDTFQAIVLGKVLMNKRKWKIVPVGQQQSGDVGSTCGSKPHHGNDHIYLVLRVLNSDEMVVADNQDTAPHFRFASGAGGKKPTKFFLRAEGLRFHRRADVMGDKSRGRKPEPAGRSAKAKRSKHKHT